MASAALALWTAGCAERLPDQDLRILQAVPVAKLSTDILYKEYQADKRAADRRYHGRPIEISGKPWAAIGDAPPRLFFASEMGSSSGVEARLLLDQAVATLESGKTGNRVTLRCFCEGLATNVILKSCIRP